MIATSDAFLAELRAALAEHTAVEVDLSAVPAMDLTGLQILLLLFAAVTLGGLGTAFGALVGALIIGLVVELSPVLGMPGDFKYATALLILILLLLVRPQGLLGKPQRIG